MIDGMVRVGVTLGLALVLVMALAPAGARPRPGAAAPDVSGGPWINSRPLTLAELRGRVVLVDFWTYG